MALTIYAGDLRHVVELLAPNETKGDQGDVETTYEVALTTRAYIRNPTRRRAQEGSETVLLHDKEFFIRWQPEREAISAQWHLRWEGNEYLVHEVENLELNDRFIRLNCKGRD